MTIYTVGHSTRSAQQLLAILRGADVKLVADVRAFPSSRRHPQFNRAALREWLPHAGICYVHMPGLGGRRKPAPDSANTGWREPAFRAYADYMASEEFRRALADLEGAGGERPTAVMCAEAVWWRCHRRLIADALTARGWHVKHLGVREPPPVHELAEFAVTDPSGTITYPQRQATLLDR
jgi:uncharacterized protein (DUF488 family)